MDPTSLTVKSIYAAYQQYQQNQRNQVNIETNFDSFFDTFASLLLNNSKSISEFLTILTPNVASNNPVFIKFMDEFSFRLLNTKPTVGVKVLKTLLNTVQKLSSTKMISLTKFIWERKSFRSLIRYYPRSDTGKLYMTESIFSNVFPKDGSINNEIKISLEAFTPLTINKDISHDLMQYIDDIFKKNVGFTYDDPNMMNKAIMSTTDMLTLCFVIMTDILKINYEDPKTIPEYMLRIFWNGINVVYITSHIMNRTITDSIRYCIERNEELKKIKNPTIDEKREMINMKASITQGDTMINNLNKYTSLIDTEYVETMMFEYPTSVNYIINNKNYDLIQRLIEDVGQTSINVLISRTKTDKDTILLRLSKFVLAILKNTDFSVHIKFNAMRLMLSHNLKDTILNDTDGVDILIRYIVEDVIRLKDVEHAHLIDLMIELADTSIIKQSDIMELYMYLLPEFSEHYNKLLKAFVYVSEEILPQVIIDIRLLISVTLVIVQNISCIGNNSLSYIEDVLSFIETLRNTYILIKNITKEDLSPVLAADLEKTRNMFVNFKSSYSEQIKPLIVQMFKDLQTSVCRIIITNESDRILHELFGSDYDDTVYPLIKVIDSSQVPIDLVDTIKCDIALNPYYITTGSTNSTDSINNIQYHLIDRKTYYGIIRMKTNPFTRESIDKESLDRLNEQDNIKFMRNDVWSRILNI